MSKKTITANSAASAGLEATRERTAEAKLEEAARAGADVVVKDSGAAIKDSPVRVKIYCKLPGGMRFPLPDGGSLLLKGARGSDAVCGFGITRDVSYPTWEYIKSTYAAIPAFSRGLIFMQDNNSEDTGEAKEKAGEKSGFEGVDPKKPGQGLEPSDKK